MSKDKMAEVFHFDLYGKRDSKYDFLIENSLGNVKWEKLNLAEPNFFFLQKDFKGEVSYRKGISLIELMPIKTSGIKSHDDSNLISFTKFENFNYKYHYRVFDDRYIHYDLSKVLRNRYSVMKNILEKPDNTCLITTRQESTFDFQHIFLTKLMVDINSISLQTKEISYCLPLYVYLDKTSEKLIDDSQVRSPNFNIKIIDEIAKMLNLAFVEDDKFVVDLAEGFDGTLYPTDMLDYIYAVLHSPAYRKKYKEFLKIDFPRVPYPTDADTFWKLVELGKQIRELHLLESPLLNKPITKYPVDGDNIVGKPKFETYKYAEELPDENGNYNYPDYLGTVHINETQYFSDVPSSAWEFYIGGYQPAQKWLKDRKGRTLEYEDIIHYQKIIVALKETGRLMNEVDLVGVEW